ncbi:MAG TPA: redoxin domain-containing protein [Pirellulales bacterium]|nr:redoxin domain-containing protein [Pirellulales bacterium]
MRWFASWLLLLATSAGALGGETPASPLGRSIENFKLQDFRGAWHELDDWSDKQAVVIAFLGVECPLAKLYAPRLVELAEEYGPRGVAVVGIDANQQDSLAEIAHYARIHHVEFPLLKDPGNRVADQFGAVRTPEAFVLDRRRVVRYWGRIDDQYGIGYARERPQRRDVAVALEELLAGKTVSTPVALAPGCHIGRISRKPPTGDITHSKDVAAILQRRCAECHRPGQAAPFELAVYRDAASWSEMIREVLVEGRMPPWHANPRFGEFSNDRRMPDEEKQTVLAWIDNGMPEGDAAASPPQTKFAEGWRISKPDFEVRMPKTFAVPAKGTVEFQYFVVDPGFTEDVWVQEAEVRPGNRAVVHHLILYYAEPGRNPKRGEAPLFNAIAIYAPGLPPAVFPPGTAKRIPAGSRLGFEVHYTSNGSEQLDRSFAGLVFADRKQVKQELRTVIAVNTQFHIPPGDAAYRVEAEYHFDQDMRLYSMLPHMHLRGKAFRFEAVFPDGRQETLLDVPRYDFNWQYSYMLAKPKLMPQGTVIRCTAKFDNSADNLANPDPAATVGWGETTAEEMMIGRMEATVEDQDLRLGMPQVRRLEGDQYEATFVYRAAAGVKSVHLAGSFNDFSDNSHPMQGPDRQGRFRLTLKLKPGVYEYRYRIDDREWRSDPGNPVQVGYYRNSVLKIGPKR